MKINWCGGGRGGGGRAGVVVRIKSSSIRGVYKLNQPLFVRANLIKVGARKVLKPNFLLRFYIHYKLHVHVLTSSASDMLLGDTYLN